MLLLLLLIPIIIILVLFLIGFFYRPKKQIVYLDTGGSGASKKMCQNEPIRCETDSDCRAICEDDTEMSCQYLSRSNSDQEKIYGSAGNYCLPTIPKKPCDTTKGGILVWTGWSSTDRMEWDCLCAYPEYFGNNGCTQLNSGICEGGEFDYDATKMKRSPAITDCKCGSDSYLLVNKQGDLPLCINKSVYPHYFGNSCVAPGYSAPSDGDCCNGIRDGNICR